MSFLAIDIGNTRLKWGLFDSLAPQASMMGHGAVFLENVEQLAEVDWAALRAPELILGCCVASDAVRRRVVDQIRELWDAPPRWVVARAAEAGVINGYDHPSRLGADRWVAMIAARQRMLRAGVLRPLLVVMVGTAVTVDALDMNGHFMGGLILPGHGIMLRSLEGGTAGLRVPTGDVCDFPCNTSDALTTGGTYAITGAIERLHRNLTQRLGKVPHCVVAGGAGWKVARHLGIPYELVESLLFEGLRVLGDLRRQGQAGQDAPTTVY